MSIWTNEVQPFGANRTPLLVGLSSTDGATPVPVAVDPTSGAVLTSGGGSGGGGTQYTSGGSAVTNPTGNSLIYFNGSNVPVAVTSSNPLPITGTISVGSTTDEATFTAGTSTTGPIAGAFNDSLTVLTSGQQGTARITGYRAVHMNLRNNTGTEIGTSTTPIQVSLANTATNSTSVNANITNTTLAVTESGTWNVGASSATGSSVPANAFFIGIQDGGGLLRGAYSVAGGAGTSGTGVLAAGNMVSKSSALQVVTANSTTATGVSADTNIVSILGTAPTTVGKLDVKGADGDVFVRQTTAANLNATVVGTGTLAVQNTAATPSGTNGIGNVGTVSAVINVNQKTVNTTAVQLSATSTIPTNGIIVQALSTNSASIFVGGSGVTATTGFELVAGQSMSFTANLNTLYIISAASTTDKACYNVE